MRPIAFGIRRRSSHQLLLLLGPGIRAGRKRGRAYPRNQIPEGYRNWQLISVNHLAGGNLKQVRAQLVNDIAIKAFQEIATMSSPVTHLSSERAHS